MKKILVSPSILCGDFANLGEQCKKLIDCGADFLHCDIMDGVFVPNISFGLPVVRDVKRACNGTLDVHLMIENPEKYLKQFADVGADMLTFHIEATKNVDECINIVKSCNKKVGISLKPNTPVSVLLPFLSKIDLVLIMSVEPGFAGQKFLPVALHKIAELRKLSSQVLIEVDGGITLNNVQEVANAGADAVVAGSTIFNSADFADTISKLSLQK